MNSLHPPIPTGLRPSAQGCEATLSHGIEMVINPNGVVAVVVMNGTQPRWGWMPCERFSQGSAPRATLGFGPESRWDSSFNQRGGLGKARQLFGEQLPKLLDELNEALAA